MKDGRLNTGDFLLPVSVDKLPSRYSLLNPDVSKKIKKTETRIKIRKINVMDKIWDRKSFELGGHWPLWRG